MGEVSSFLIITAIAALGMKTSLLALARIGMAPVMLLIPYSKSSSSAHAARPLGI